jgi:hypothetical protein
LFARSVFCSLADGEKQADRSDLKHRGLLSVNRIYPRARDVLVCGFIAIVPAAFSQSATFLRPDNFSATVGDSLRISVARSDGAAIRATEWPTEVDWMFVRSLGAQSNLEDPRPKRAADNFLRIPMDDPGVTLIGLDERPRVESFPAEQFRAFVRASISGGNGIMSQGRPRSGDAVGAQPVRVRVLASSKALVRVHQSPRLRPAHSAAAQGKTGQQVELRALADPTMVPVGGDLPLRTYVRGGKVGGVLVRATNERTGAIADTSADDAGICKFRITAAGIWRVEFFHVEASNESDADWTLYSASLVFEVPEQGAAE